ncbi:MAG TPA: hypothetical protein VEI57_04125 [Nitrospirota bacterium]|nr:hypothetical protein [Nitrospirota bacterium]
MVKNMPQTGDPNFRFDFPDTVGLKKGILLQRMARRGTSISSPEGNMKVAKSYIDNKFRK